MHLSYDFRTQRLHVEFPLRAGEARLEKEQSHYLLNVLRSKIGESVLLFNGRDGEWAARIAAAERKIVVLEVLERTREQPPGTGIGLAFAPIKHARLDYMVQKAVEMGACRLSPVITRYTNVQRVNLERMRANVVEAAEQCGILSVPAVADEVKFEAWLTALPRERTLVFCDEDAPVRNPVAALQAVPAGAEMEVVIGPEGGFAPEERERLLARDGVVQLSLGPRILRADTAAVAALALVQAVRGDASG